MPSEFDPEDRAPGDLTPEETLRRLESIYGEAPEGEPDQFRVAAPIRDDKTSVQPAVGRPRPSADQIAGAYGETPNSKANSGRSGASRPVRSGGAGNATAKAAQPKRKRKRNWYKPKLRWIFLYLPLLIILAILGVAAWGWNEFSSIYRVDTEDALSAASATGTNYLIVGSDSRDGVDPENPNVGAIGLEVEGRRADTIIVMRIEGSEASMMSIPRDLWVMNAATGSNGRINGTYNKGAPNLISTVTTELGIPVHHYLEVDFVSFAGMVDAVGGIDIDFPHPAFDKGSGLVVLTPGTHKLSGDQALSYVRARHYTEIIDGREVPDPTGDIGRQARQQVFITKVMSEVGSTKNPVALAKIAGAAAEGMRIDDHFGFFDATGFALGLGKANMSTVVLPTYPATVGGASVLFLDKPNAVEPLRIFEGGTG